MTAASLEQSIGIKMENHRQLIEKEDNSFNCKTYMIKLMNVRLIMKSSFVVMRGSRKSYEGHTRFLSFRGGTDECEKVLILSQIFFK